MKNGRFFRTLIMATAIGMFLVLLGGITVTKTGSGMGCGDDWPLCNGKFLPAYTLTSIIEYSHRMVSGIVGILVLASTIAVWRRMKQRKDAKLYAATALFFTILQALLGAAAVKWEQSSLVMALHFGFSLIAFAGTLLLAITVVRMDRPAHPDGWGEALDAGFRVSTRFRNGVWFSLVYCYVVVYLGAFVRHTESMAGCEGWPLCSGEVIPQDWSGGTGIAFIHRVAALLLFVLIAWIGHIGYRRYGEVRPVRAASLAAAILIALQVTTGGVVALSLHHDQIYFFASMLHTIVVAGLFGVLCYLSILVGRLGSRT
ncbi:heme A synthase [Xylanibacillus composti]|uniref:Heme A synthase n=1 Tax=Xylanibacillus composti TaxID=1572762 RepID=A0A8J4H4L8_9BACL|nr:heme A synthase [Xylanibacillus composti]MDT9723516.1 heme A synthase [Xylanibacillus composti]GIQ68448.1 heme A synthase [Xylanibacillus composti]